MKKLFSIFIVLGILMFSTTCFASAFNEVYFNGNNKPSPSNDKSAIQLFFSEHLASKKRVEFSKEFIQKIELINKKIEEYFSSI